MGRVNRFEDLIAWQKAKRLVGSIYRLTRTGALARDIDLVRQMRRSSVSIMSNIAEGFERGRLTEFHQYLSTAKASSGELRSQLYAAHEAGHVTEVELSPVMAEAMEVSKIIGGLRAAVGRKCQIQSGKRCGTRRGRASR